MRRPHVGFRSEHGGRDGWSPVMIDSLVGLFGKVHSGSFRNLGAPAPRCRELDAT
jgi:hypothetical protein